MSCLFLYIKVQPKSDCGIYSSLLKHSRQTALACSYLCCHMIVLKYIDFNNSIVGFGLVNIYNFQLLKMKVFVVLIAWYSDRLVYFVVLITSGPNLRMAWLFMAMSHY